jgi:FlaA1/EpsC-like NDP-sugar epimerase
MFIICQRVYKKDSENLVCLNWILASVEYPKFVAMMLEFKVVIQGGKQWKQNELEAEQYDELQKKQQEYYKSLGGKPQQIIDSGKPRVLITGINGYVGSQVCMAFLKHGGYQIRGTIRNKQDTKKYGEILKAFGPEYLA